MMATAVVGWADAAHAPSEHPDFGNLVLLVFEAVLEVVFVSLPGYLVARAGMFDAEAQMFVAKLNVMVFTPCLIFTKLGSKLSLEQFKDLIIIPFIFAAQTLVSYASAVLVSRAFGFRKRPRNFVIAMGVFGNSNSLPISLVLSLAKTISGLHWDKIPGDNDNDVASRGILYLMIFQQLGQLMRWTWGFNVLLQPAHKYTPEDGGTSGAVTPALYQDLEEEIPPSGTYFDSPRTSIDVANTVPVVSPPQSPTNAEARHHRNSRDSAKKNHRRERPVIAPLPTTPLIEPVKRHTLPRNETQLHTSIEANGNGSVPRQSNKPPRRPSLVKRTTEFGHQKVSSLRAFSGRLLAPLFHALPVPIQSVLATLWRYFVRFSHGMWQFMNPPLWAMLVAIVVSTVPPLKALFFTPRNFVNNTVTHAISQSAGVAVPLILVVLGANLARTTSHSEDSDSESEDESQQPAAYLRYLAQERHLERKLLIASIISRMVLPLLIMLPILALTAKFVPVSILDDPIFIIVCFLLTGAPSALQLAQMCQLHDVYMGAVSKMLVHSYVIWLLPSTLVLVTCALKVVEWADS